MAVTITVNPWKQHREMLIDLFYACLPLSPEDDAYVQAVWEDWDRSLPMPLEMLNRLKQIHESIDQI